MPFMQLKVVIIAMFYVIMIKYTVGCTELKLEGGRLECRLSDGTWGTVCNRGFYANAANAACRQLGYSSASVHKTK